MSVRTKQSTIIQNVLTAQQAIQKLEKNKSLNKIDIQALKWAVLDTTTKQLFTTTSNDQVFENKI